MAESRRRQIPRRNPASPAAGPRGGAGRQEPGPGLGRAAAARAGGAADARRRPGRLPGPTTASEQLGGAAWLSADADFAVAEWNRTRLRPGPLPAADPRPDAAGRRGGQFPPGRLPLPARASSCPTSRGSIRCKGLQRIFSLANVVRLVFGLFKIGVIAAVAYACLYNEREKILGLTALAVPEIAAVPGADPALDRA